MPSASLHNDFLEAAARRRVAADPVGMMRAAGIEPDAWQERVLRSQAQQIILCCGRQVGKSTVSSGLAVHTALTTAHALIVMISPGLRQSRELFLKAVRVYQALGRPVSPLAESKLSLELANGSRIVALPGSSDTVRGFSGVRLLLVDEAAFTPDDLYYSVRPMLAASNGRLALLSSPHGTRGFFYEAWEHGGENWDRYSVPSADCPRISPAFLAEERRNMGEWWYRQEYECLFLDAETQLFKREDVEAAMDSSVEQWELPAWPQ